MKDRGTIKAGPVASLTLFAIWLVGLVMIVYPLATAAVSTVFLGAALPVSYTHLTLPTILLV